MSFLGLVLRALSVRKLSSILTALSVALGVMLVVTILTLREELAETYERPGRGYGFVVGPPKGSELQLVLNSVYHLQQSAGLLPWSVHEEVTRHPYNRIAIPYAVGDSFRGHRVVATTDGIFDRVFPHPAGTGAEKLAAGRPFHYREADLFAAFERLPGQKGRWQERIASAGGQSATERPKAEAVVGWNVQKKHGLKVNDRIEVTHGTEGGGVAHDHAHIWTVVGILKQTGTPVDDVLFVNIDSFYRIADHLEGAIIPSVNEPGISASLVFPTPKVGKALLGGWLKTRENLIAAEVSTEIRKLLTLIGDVDRIFFWIAIMVVLIGLTSILVAIYNTMNERRRELAILRALGAPRLRVMGTIVTEAALLSFIGALLGLILAHGLLALLAEPLETAARLLINPLHILAVEPLVLLLVTIVGAIAGLIPAIKAYLTDVAAHLAPTS